MIPTTARQEIFRDLRRLIRFPTVSSDPHRRAAMHECAAWLAEHYYSIGMKQVRIFNTSSHPIVYAEYLSDPALPTILFYGHYDVQPPDPLDKWETPPFEAVIRGDYIFGRGASDDKGQFFIHIKAVQALLNTSRATGRRLPVNIKFVTEGAEEIGSPGFRDFVTRERQRLQCDVAVVSDTKMASRFVPALTYSLRGSLNAEIRVRTLARDLHSGTFGGAVPNAAIQLSEFLASLHNRDHRIAIPGFYDGVERPGPEQRRFIRENGMSDKALLQEARVRVPRGEAGYTLHERITIRPSLSVTGITAGYQGPGIKNVIPAVATAKLNIRLVPEQDPQRIRALLNDFIRKTIPDAAVKISYSSFARPVNVSADHPYVMAAARASEDVFRRPVKFVQNGGTIAAVDDLSAVLGIPVLLMGFAQAGDNMHAPNEHFYLPNFFRGIETIRRFIQLVAT